jgi:hypothetical protein
VNQLRILSSMILAATRSLKAYDRSIQKNPLATKAATCFVGFAAGDLAAQALTCQPQCITNGQLTATYTPKFDFDRTVRMAVFGALVAAPQMHVFFSWLDKVRARCLCNLK